MNRTPILQGKHAVVFGAGGSFGSVVAREFAAEGAEVFLSGRSKPGLEEVAKHITAEGWGGTCCRDPRGGPRRG